MGGFNFHQGQEIFVIPKAPSLAVAHQPSHPVPVFLCGGYQGLFAVVKCFKSVADHSPSFSAKVTNGWSGTSTLHIYIYSVNRDTFAM